MPEETTTAAQDAPGSATYEVIRQRLEARASELQEKSSALDALRRTVFGSVGYALLQGDRITTSHNCVPQDMVEIGEGTFLFGFNVRFGLKNETALGDVFAVYRRDEASGSFQEVEPTLLQDPKFLTDFARIYRVYEHATFRKFSVAEGSLYMVFRTGAAEGDIAAFRWEILGDSLSYADGRAETDYRRIGFPPPHNFRWAIPDRDSYRYGDFPHISIEDRVFVECVGGHLTIKIEDNTKTGEGIYAEPVEDKRQKVDDAEIAYAVLGHLILLKVRPYKEREARYFIFNEKLGEVVRVDSLGHSCAALPEDQGLIFPDGTYLGTGELKLFGGQGDHHVLERIVHSPNGEDSLYVFYSAASGEYVLLPYRLIEQKIVERITCHGFSLFPDGQLLLFRADPEPQKHHTIQLRQTPFYVAGREPDGQRDAFLYQVGNKEVVRCLAECHEVLTLVRREEPYVELYADLVKRCGAMLDSYPWMSHKDCEGLDEALRGVREAADRAVDEFDNLLRLRQEAARSLDEAAARCTARFEEIRRAPLQALDEFVVHLAALRTLTGELMTLREVRSIDIQRVAALEESVSVELASLSKTCVEFLLKPHALDPYREKAEDHLAAAARVARVAEAVTIEEAVGETARALEMLIEIVNGLQIEDATETTRILDGITSIYTTLNQARGELKNRRQSLGATEGAARFDAQMKLLGQSAASFLDLCDSPSKCEEYLNKISVQIEEMEGAFSDFEDFLVAIADRRVELTEAFEQRKVALVEARSRKATALQTAADRILKVIGNRLANFSTPQEIHTYLASDPMVAKVRKTADQLMELEDSLKADDLTTRLKSLGQEALRQLKDRQDLFAGGPGVIRIGRHEFHVNTQPLDLTVVHREGRQFLHITGTRYFDPIDDPDLLATRAVWDQELVSENASVYRSETLARRMLEALEADPSCDLDAIRNQPDEITLTAIQEFMAGRYQEGYTRGIHGIDAAKIFSALLEARLDLGLARFRPEVRAMAVVFWSQFCDKETRKLWQARTKGFGECNRVFPGDPVQVAYIRELGRLLEAFARETGLFDPSGAAEAAEYLFLELTAHDSFVCSREGEELVSAFRAHLVSKGAEAAFEAAIAAMSAHPVGRLDLIRDWLRGFLRNHPAGTASLEEAAALLFCGDATPRRVIAGVTGRRIEGCKGGHPRIKEGVYPFDYLDFQARLDAFERDVVPLFQRYHQLKHEHIEKERAAFRLSELTPQVLTSFVRNQLIDKVYLPLIGDNLAKQMGAAGDAKRTDRSGLLLLVSPPGYGKTTLLEYLASRLGIHFVKINGPALGYGTKSLDPQEAPNAAAREEINRLNLALEMGDNILLCIDDIQHCSSEFLQKFISLCDAQRKIEGVWRGQARTYDLRGRKVVVAMAGNPYTETGQRFRIPDMLSNRADTYNLGDIVGGNDAWFKASFLENAATSNSTLAPIATRSLNDLRTFLQMAESGDRDPSGFEANYSPREIEDVLSVLKKLLSVRDVVLAVNLEYIRSAAQSDEFRTEPAFKLQGSYRNMNRLAEKILPILEDQEVQAILLDHYRNESQTLTSDTEANLLKLRELLGILTESESLRWGEIKETFRRNQVTRGGEDDPAARVVAQLYTLGTGLDGLRQTLAEGLAPSDGADIESRMRSILHEYEMIHATLASIQDLSIQQRDALEKAREELAFRAKQGVIEVNLTDEMLSNQQAFLDHFQKVLAARRSGET